MKGGRRVVGYPHEIVSAIVDVRCVTRLGDFKTEVIDPCLRVLLRCPVGDWDTTR